MERDLKEFEKAFKETGLKLKEDEVLRQKIKILELYKVIFNFEKIKGRSLKNKAKNGEKIYQDWRACKNPKRASTDFKKVGEDGCSEINQKLRKKY
ncbi:MAG: hypothetical protein KatS3mg097_543 [Candidatus Parcubacteria bacterium]|nr:MAG: hypothetical protein KatS3mg097_543 [Candidatus Parcubacteria bacterium]